MELSIIVYNKKPVAITFSNNPVRSKIQLLTKCGKTLDCSMMRPKAPHFSHSFDVYAQRISEDLYNVPKEHHSRSFLELTASKRCYRKLTGKNICEYHTFWHDPYSGWITVFLGDEKRYLSGGFCDALLYAEDQKQFKAACDAWYKRYTLHQAKAA